MPSTTPTADSSESRDDLEAVPQRDQGPAEPDTDADVVAERPDNPKARGNYFQPLTIPTARPPTRPAAPATREAPHRVLVPQPEPIAGVSDEQIGQAITRGANWLLQQFDPQAMQLRQVEGRPSDVAYVCGQNALAIYALLQCGQAINNPRLDARGPLMGQLLDRLKRQAADPGYPEVYARSLRAAALAMGNRTEDRTMLRLDMAYLLRADKNGAYTYSSENSVRSRRGGPRAGRPPGAWDNSNSQYGLLGVWSAAETGLEVQTDYWANVEQHWTECQIENGQWGYRDGSAGSGTLSMTAAGTASLFVTQDYLDPVRFGSKVGRPPFSPALSKALDWWEADNHSVRIPGGWWGYTLYGIERVGLASGFKYFGQNDWYRELAQQAVERQDEAGRWSSVIDTSYALLFLARGRHPILMNKLRFEDNWANRPRDAANLTRYASRQLERTLNWQVVPLNRPWHDWLDSPILYLASHKALELMPKDYDNLREYVEAGGLLFTHADGDSHEFAVSAEQLAKTLFPQYEVKPLPADHPIYGVVYKIEPRPPLLAVSNGSRILMVLSPLDIAKHWQLRNETTDRNVFQLGVNLFVYAAGKREFRNRLSSPYVSAPQATPLGRRSVARIQYSGNWDPEPGAYRRFANWLGRQTGLGLDIHVVAWKDLRPGAADLAILTGTAAYVSTDAEMEALTQFVQAGGVVLIDTAGGFDGAFSKPLRAALSKITGASVAPVANDHPLLRADEAGMSDLSRPRLRPYAVETLGAAGIGLPDLMAVGRGHVLISDRDVTSGLLGTQTWRILGYSPDYCQQLLKNAIFWAMDGQPDRAPAERVHHAAS